MSILFCSAAEPAEPWRQACARAFPEMDFRVWPDRGPLQSIRYALAWKQPPGSLAGLPNLRRVLVLGAGVDGVLDDPDLPEGVAVIRLVGAGLPAPMAQYALYAVLHFHRRMSDYFEQQRAALWQPRAELPARLWPVGVMGLGVIGAHVAQRIAQSGYPVAGWSRSGTVVEGVDCFAGAGGFGPFLARAQVLINVLPLTAATRGILNARAFAAMPRGAYVVNIGRGAHLVEQDLIAALDSGQLGGAVLDVFEREPLPADHPFWRHPGIRVTPHVAAPTAADEAQAQIVDNIRRMERGEAPLGLVERSRGY